MSTAVANDQEALLPALHGEIENFLSLLLWSQVPNLVTSFPTIVLPVLL